MWWQQSQEGARLVVGDRERESPLGLRFGSSPAEPVSSIHSYWTLSPQVCFVPPMHQACSSHSGLNLIYPSLPSHQSRGSHSPPSGLQSISDMSAVSFKPSSHQTAVLRTDAQCSSRGPIPCYTSGSGEIHGNEAWTCQTGVVGALTIQLRAAEPEAHAKSIQRGILRIVRLVCRA
ncbi:hypothetical protein P154DRAFT_346683 [Amniculicola lignicola CBS 123094]|uniref:Uncharacterized protein n=1 Tax=Amniculicola lignicola CBS 123094 TaxID=1392246 RepID=A0A6A5W0Q2_9PLEO|nr:hypothetical protein P154DRAFT_346683 [Amniculicola lignicola CBS 123094]